ncbi:class I SAM-dependent DNA methyltransferase [Deinococcus sp. SL84]|uniref:class I SAM-dependent DNA methyltransferase n=1 Tax=Deinococcus sp. SL84 TaxID=2994663 RepID=UPI0022729D19|nr:DNA methyltransferase [Deinococcus sp. SL84]MCY1703856.1 class I SAM-dependent DNA methyltransferase [Deinococcus sp. SL84]
MNPAELIARWKDTGGSERANYTGFLIDLCDVLGVPRPEGSRVDVTQNAYVFERDVAEHHPDGSVSHRRIDLYRRGSFVLEAKQGVEQEAEQEASILGKKPAKTATKKGHGKRGTKGWDGFMLRAREQAQQYVGLLPAEEGRPPFLLVTDVGHAIEVYAEFTRTGGAYRPFPSAGKHRIMLEDLEKPEVRELLRTIWLDPMSLDPSARAARVTAEIARLLAQASRQMEGRPDKDGTPLTAERVSAYLMRMIFTMFAEDVELLPPGKFTGLLDELQSDPQTFSGVLEELWQKMAHGGVSAGLRSTIRHFNGGLFEDAEVLPVTGEELRLFREAASYDWSQVEPSIFGTLVERALNKDERHKLGAHYTPRAYVERLVTRTVMEPLRRDWGSVQAAVQRRLDDALEMDEKGQQKAREAARKEVERFLASLQDIKILDPACGTGNFLYVSMELLSALESEVTHTLEDLGGVAPLIGISPRQFLGIELNPRAAKVADLVLWIGYLQLYAREHGKANPPPEPILQAYHNIENRDAILDFAGTEPRLGKDGQPVQRWDGRTTLTDPVTGREVPDPAALVQDVTYLQPKKAAWPRADFIVGNPPFIGAGPMRLALGDGYTETIRKLYKDVPASADFVMFWWQRAAELLAYAHGNKEKNALRRFGFVTTNSIKQTFNRRVIENFVGPGKNLSLMYAVPDHPWVDAADGAAVRIAMTVVQPGRSPGVLEVVVNDGAEVDGAYEVETVTRTGMIHPDLTVGADVAGAGELKAMQGLASRGVMLFGSGFIIPRTAEADPVTGITPPNAAELGLGKVDGLEQYIREYRNGRDLAARPRDVMVIDLFGLTAEEVQAQYPEVYQHVRLTVKPERDANRDAAIRQNWWLHGRTRSSFRPALSGLPRYIATVETSKHRFFQFLGEEILPDNMLVAIASDDAYVLGVLSSRFHVAWALAQGGRLGMGNDPRYNKSRCFETFPFPDATPEQQQAIREKAEALDAHRKRQLERHPKLTMTDMYNALEALRRGEVLEGKLRQAHDDGLVTILKDLHDELDVLVAAAYGWPADLAEADVLAELANLNAVRAAQEKTGDIQWLRPEYQNPAGKVAGKQELGLEVQEKVAAAEKQPWPTNMPEQIGAVRDYLLAAGQPLTLKEVVLGFKGASTQKVTPLLESLVSLSLVKVEQGAEVRFRA